jgi:hypothetical protein
MDEAKNEALEVKQTELAVQEAGPVSIWNNTAMFDQAVKQAKILAQSDLVPTDTYKNKPANCLIALDMAYRMNMSPLNVMQNLFIVKGKPGWSGQYCIAAVNACPRFQTKLEFVQLVEPDGKTKGYYAQATEAGTGKVCVGPPVTWQMVKDEGWYDKNGSKWKTMPDLMFRYRAAAFFARTYCPEVLNGLQTVDELRDVRGYDEVAQKTVITLD